MHAIAGPRLATASTSVLLTREAGPRAPVGARVRFGSIGPDAASAQGAIRLVMAGRPVGTVVDGNPLSDAQVAALLKALVGSGEIVFASGKTRWHLSGKGAAAVLLRMDDVQHRIGTQDEPLARAILAVREDEDCDEANDPRPGEGADGGEPTLWRLGGGRVLVSRYCNRRRYNVTSGYWLANDKPPYDPVQVTDLGSDFDPGQGQLVSSMKGRGIGDCYSRSEWTWDGRDFVPTRESTTGQCRGVDAGGSWDLPTLVVEVRKPR